LLVLAAAAAARLPPDDVIRGILKQRVDDYHQSVDIVVGNNRPEGAQGGELWGA
jgi:hypothetical protein